jgi:cobalt/nickel transport protein
MVKPGGFLHEFFWVLAALMGVVFSALTGLAHFQVFWPQTEGLLCQTGGGGDLAVFLGPPLRDAHRRRPDAQVFRFHPGKKKDTPAVKKITLKDQASGRDRQAFQVAYKPAGPGDYYLCLESPPYFIPENQVFWQDYVKEPLHVRAEKGWDQAVGLPVEIIPLTRPYGWPAGSVFKGQAVVKNKALTRATVEIEKFNGFFVPADKMPKDRLGEENAPLITRVVKTDRMGYFTCTLDSPGWWIMSVSAPGGKKVHEGKTYPVEMRGGLWVYVEPPPPPLSPPARKEGPNAGKIANAADLNFPKIYD